MPLTSFLRKPITLKFKLRLKVLKIKLKESLRSQVKEKVKLLIKKRVKSLKIKKILTLPALRKILLW